MCIHTITPFPTLPSEPDDSMYQISAKKLKEYCLTERALQQFLNIPQTLSQILKRGLHITGYNQPKIYLSSRELGNWKNQGYKNKHKTCHEAKMRPKTRYLEQRHISCLHKSYPKIHIP